MLLPAGQRRVHEHAHPRADGHEGGSRRGPLPRERRVRQAAGGRRGSLCVTSSNGSAVAARSPDGRVLVTGASGFLGGRLARRLISDGAPVRVLVRSDAKARVWADRGAETVVGDITDRDAVRAALDSVAVVYHLAGRLFIPGVPASEYRRTHVEGTKVLIACAAESAAVRRFVHCSTTGVLGTTGDTPADEDAPGRAGGAERLAARPAGGDRAPGPRLRTGRPPSAGLVPIGAARPVPAHRPPARAAASHLRRRPHRGAGVLRRARRRAARVLPHRRDRAGGALPPRCFDRQRRGHQAASGQHPPAGCPRRRRGRRPPAGRPQAARAPDAVPPRLPHPQPRVRRGQGEAPAGLRLTTGIRQSVAWYRRHGYLPAGTAA
ncbi:MAG: NAD-dependent epimerase/dehydratase family protein [Chloroflexi bacterium]|nr:MAG: NAD-dependent epimerase/dehydratase family protein [Chloroflexota bacterium]